MIVHIKPLAEVTRRAIEVLSRELGAADTMRFVNQFSTGQGDYTAERGALFADDTIEQIVADIQAARTVLLPSTGPEINREDD